MNRFGKFIFIFFSTLFFYACRSSTTPDFPKASEVAAEQKQSPLVSVVLLKIDGYASKNARLKTAFRRNESAKTCELVSDHPEYRRDPRGRVIPVVITGAERPSVDPAFDRTLDFDARPVDAHPASFFASFIRGTWQIRAGWRVFVRRVVEPNGNWNCEPGLQICTRVELRDDAYQCRSGWKELIDITVLPNRLRFLAHAHLSDEKAKDDLDGIKGTFRDTDGSGQATGDPYEQDFLRE